MQAADDVEFGDGVPSIGAPAVASDLPDLFERHGVGLGILGSLAEGAEAATGDAYVGGIDVAVDVEIGDVAVHALTHAISEPADAEQIGRAVEGDAIVETEANAGVDFLGDRPEAGVFKSWCHYDNSVARS